LYHFYKYAYIIISIFFVSFCSATTPQESPKTSVLRMQMMVSEEIRSKISIFQKLEYPSLELPKLFGNLRDKSEEVCQMAHNKKIYNDKKIREFINMNGVQVGPKGPIYNLLPRVIAGCWNYFQMNDVHPEREFQLVSKLYPDVKKECYSVGFMQPYIMHSILNCSKLNMLDIDWRIHYTHFSMVHSIQQLRQDFQIERDMNSVPFDWVAFYSKLQKDTKLTIKDICKNDPETCISAIDHFKQKGIDMVSLNLQLSPLSDITLQPEADAMSVIYTSNALDNVYTKMNELKKMIDRIHATLNGNQKALILYHNGGMSLFGIYEISSQNSKPLIVTVCKDNYYIGGMPDNEKSFINLDKLSSNDKKAPTCNSLYKKVYLQK
jgi:hypothetical protein